MKYSIIHCSMKTERNDEFKKKSRNTAILFSVFVLFAMAATKVLWGQLQEKGATAVVTVDGEEYYRSSLFIEKEIAIDDCNTLVIREGRADMIFADCPDQICVKHAPISNVGETIICLPNKVVVTIESLTGNEKPAQTEIDVIVK